MLETSEKPQNQKVAFDPSRYSKRVLGLILAKAQTASCTPSEAEVLLLEERAERREQIIKAKGGK